MVLAGHRRGYRLALTPRGDIIPRDRPHRSQLAPEYGSLQPRYGKDPLHGDRFDPGGAPAQRAAIQVAGLPVGRAKIPDRFEPGGISRPPEPASPSRDMLPPKH